MSLITSRIVRCKAVINSPFATVGLIDVATNQTIETVKGNATRFQFAFYTTDGALANLSNVSSINLKIRPTQIPDGTTLADKTVPFSSLDLTTNHTTWQNGTKQHVEFAFSNAEMNIAMSEAKKNFWLVVTAYLNTGEEVTLGGGSVVWHEDNNSTAGSPPENPGTSITIEQGDARYEARHLSLTAPPTQGVLGTPATGLVSVTSIPTAGQGISVTGDNGTVYVVFGPGEGQIPIPASEAATAQAIVTALNSWGEVTATRTGSTVNIASVRPAAMFPYAVLGGALWPMVGATLQGGSPSVTGTPGIVGQRALVTQTSGGNTVTTTWLCTHTTPFTWMREVNIYGGNQLYGPHEIDGTLWVKNNALFSGNLNVSGQLESSPSQALASGNSVLTRSLGDGRYSPLIPNDNVMIRAMSRRVEVGFRATGGNESAGVTLSQGAGDQKVQIGTMPATVDGYFSRVIDFAYSHGSINYPEGVWFMVGISALINAADAFLFVGNYNPADISGNTSRTSPFFPSSLASQEGRWFFQIQRKPAGNSSSWQCRVVSRTEAGVYNESPWIELANETATAHEKPLYLFMRIGANVPGDTRNIQFYGLRAGGRRPLTANNLSDLVPLGEAPVITASYPQILRVGAVSPSAIAENVIMFHNPQCLGYA